MTSRSIAPADVVGVAPMAGRGTRLGGSVSKEIVPLGSGSGDVLSSVMLSRMSEAGLTQAVLTVADHKQDVRDYLGARFAGTNLTLHYVFANASPNTPTSIDAGYELLKDKVCALGFADILYRPCAGYLRALAMLERSGCDVVLGLFPTSQTLAVDMVAFDSAGRVRNILIKQVAGEQFYYTWSLAVWRPVFTQFMHDWLQQDRREANGGRELFVGDVLSAAQKAGLRVRAVPVSSVGSLDAGTPENLSLARSLSW